jgi:hypothetical protein
MTWVHATLRQAKEHKGLRRIGKVEEGESSHLPAATDSVELLGEEERPEWDKRSGMVWRLEVSWAKLKVWKEAPLPTHACRTAKTGQQALWILCSGAEIRDDKWVQLWFWISQNLTGIFQFWTVRLESVISQFLKIIKFFRVIVLIIWSNFPIEV